MGRIVRSEYPYHIANSRHYLGRLVGVSDWFRIDQAQIDAFARTTHDSNRLHVDSEWSRKHGPYGAPVAHGFLTLSLLTHLSLSAQLMPEGVDYGINLGFERVRFLAPVPADTHIRMKAILLECEARGQGRWTYKSRCNIEVRETEKVALSAIWQVLFVSAREASESDALLEDTVAQQRA